MMYTYSDNYSVKSSEYFHDRGGCKLIVAIAHGVNTTLHRAHAVCLYLVRIERVLLFEPWDRYSSRVMKKLTMRCVRVSNNRKHRAIIIRGRVPSIYMIENDVSSIILEEL